MGSLSLDFRPNFIPKTITTFLEEVSKMGSLREKVLQVDHFVHRLECESTKLEAFKHRLPLSMLLLNDAIVALKEESMALKKSSYVEPVLEEFIPIKKSYDDDDDIQNEVNIGNDHNDNGDKKNWLSSTHLWNTNENHDHEANSFTQTIKKRNYEKEDASRAIFSHEINNQMIRGSGLFAEVNGNSSTRLIPFSPLNVQPADLQIRASIVHNTPSQHQTTTTTTSRKQRRSWSTELHRGFVDALQQLGGSQVATPKQIRELMQVDGLTNDEVKSHLQKYRLHTRRHSSSNTSDQNVGASKCSHSQSGSPDGPLPNGGTNMDDEDDKSENNWWNGHV